MRDAVRILSYYCCRVEVVGRWVLQGLESSCSNLDVIFDGSWWLYGVVLFKLTLTATVAYNPEPSALVLKQPREFTKAEALFIQSRGPHRLQGDRAPLTNHCSCDLEHPHVKAGSLSMVATHKCRCALSASVKPD